MSVTGGLCYLRSFFVCISSDLIGSLLLVAKMFRYAQRMLRAVVSFAMHIDSDGLLPASDFCGTIYFRPLEACSTAIA